MNTLIFLECLLCIANHSEDQDKQAGQNYYCQQFIFPMPD